MKINLKHYQQEKDYTCGPACLRMVFRYYGKKYSEKQLTKLCRSNERYGTSHANLSTAIKKAGFDCFAKGQAQRKDLTRFIDSKIPVILNFINPNSNQGHYGVLTGFTRDMKKIILADPANGNDFIISWTALEKNWRNTHNTSKRWFIAIK